MAATSVATKPKTKTTEAVPRRGGASVRIDEGLLGSARRVAESRKESAGTYLGALLGPLVERDLAKLVAKEAKLQAKATTADQLDAEAPPAKTKAKPKAKAKAPKK